MKNKEKTIIENAEILDEENIEKKKKCKMPRCETMLPVTDKHLFCENCRGKIATKARQGGVAALGIGSVIVSIATLGKVNIKK